MSYSSHLVKKLQVVKSKLSYFGLSEIPGTLLAAIMVDKVGRKFSTALMFALSFLFLLPLLAPQLPALTTALLFGARTFISGSFVIVNVYCREVTVIPYNNAISRQEYSFLFPSGQT